MTISFIQDIVPHKFRNRFLRNSGGNTIIGNSGSSYGDSVHADSADYATTAGTAQTANEAINLTNNSPLWSKFLRKDTTDTASEIITFAKGLISTLVSKFKAGFKIGENDQYEINSNGHATLNTVTGTQANFNKFAGQQGAITNIYGTQADYTNINGTQGHITHIAGNQADYNTFAGNQGLIDNLYSESIETDYLEVKKAAHFFKLIIDEIKSTKGMMLITAANAKFDLVETISVSGQNRYRCYFRSQDPDTEKEITNDFETGDLVICQTFNGAAGTQYNVSNKYYWRKCIGTGSTTKVINNQSVPVHYIDLSMAYGEYDPQPSGMAFNMVPEAGDEVSLLGNVSNTSRQSAILISAYDITWIDKEPVGTPDTQKLHAPFIVSYYGINTFDLNPYRWSIISRNLNVFKGDLSVNNNGTWTSIQDYVAQHASPGPQGPAGQQGEQGEDAIVYKLVDQGSMVQTVMTLNQSNNIVTNFVISLRFKVIKIEGGTSRFMTYEEMRDFPKVAGTSDGFYAYRKYNKDANTNNYIRLDLTTVAKAADESSTIVPTDDALFTYSYDTAYNTSYRAFKSVTVALIMYNSNYITPTSTNLKYTVDTKEIPVTLASEATLNIVQGDHASIKTLVTGQQGLAQQYSELSQTQDQISTRVTNIEEDYVTQSTLTQTADGIKSEVVSIYNDSDGIAKIRTVDLRNLSETSFYPVVVSLPPYNSQSASVTTRIIVKRLIDINYGGPSYSTHHVGNDEEAPLNGFPLYFDMSTQSCGWGNIWGPDESKPYNGEPLYVQKYEVSYTKETNNIPKEYIVGSMKQNYIGSRYENASETDDWLPSGNDEIIYLRGGSKYDIGSSWVGSAIALYSGGYQYSRTTGGTTHTYNAYVINDYNNFNVAQQDAMTKSEIIQTASNIQLNVYNDLKEKTGIDITTGQITLNADNTTINGSLKITNSTDGVVVYNDQNQKAVEVVRDSIGSFGTSQNTTTTYSDYAETYTYIVGNSSYRMYLSTYDTTAGYPREDIRVSDYTQVGSIMRIGNIAAGTVITFNAGNIIWTIGGVGGNYQGGSYAYTNDNIYSSVGNCKVRFRIHASYGNNEWPYDSGWITPSFNTSTKKFSNSSSFSYTVTAGNNNADFELWIDWKGDNPIISGSDRYKIIKFNTTATIVNTISINTKIGTDGMRTVTPDGLFWTNNERTTIARKANYGIYGANMNYGGFNMDVTGPTKTFGSSLTTLVNYDNVGQLLNVNGSNDPNDLRDRRTGFVKYNRDGSIDGVWRYEFCYNYDTSGVMPAYVYFSGVGGSYPNVSPYFTFTYNTNDNLPRGLTVTIINHCGTSLYVASHRTLPSKMYIRDSSSATNKIEIRDGSTSRFVHLGDGYFKQLNLN